MKRYKCIISYDGALFSGYQIQPNRRTVQGELESALLKMHKGQKVSVTASGRTDAGVHAKGQVIHFDSQLEIPPQKWQLALNRLLPEDIAIVSVSQVERDFHARFDALKKEYRYYIEIIPNKNPFNRHYHYQHRYPLNVNTMQSASLSLIGTYDFTSFCAANSAVENKVRTIEQIDIKEINKDLLEIKFVGNGFLYNMIRIIVGTLIEIGEGRIPSSEMAVILKGRERSLAGKTAPPQGLYLWQVFYN